METLPIPPEDAAAEARLMARLRDLGIAVATVRHPPVHTVEEARRWRGALAGGHCKCLFLKSKKGDRVLAVMDENRRADIGALARALGLGRLSFASAGDLADHLGVAPGSVTPFALLNAGGRDIVVVLERAMLAQAPLHYHPLHNRATTAIAPGDLLRFIAACGLRPRILDIDGPIGDKGSTNGAVDPI